MDRIFCWVDLATGEIAQAIYGAFDDPWLELGRAMDAVGEAGERIRFRALDACRGLCAVAVVLFHLDAATHFYNWPMVRNAYVAVDFFFVLSGFVIASAYGDRIRTVQEAGRFTLRRFGRLYPLHLVVLIAYVLVELIGFAQGSPAFVGNFSGPALAANLALVQGFGAWHETWNYPAWSVCVELWVNLGFAAVLSLLGPTERDGGHRRAAAVSRICRIRRKSVASLPGGPGSAHGRGAIRLRFRTRRGRVPPLQTSAVGRLAA